MKIDKKLSQDYFSDDAYVVAKKLLGKVIKYQNVSGIIVETECYKKDKASHGYTITPRSKIMLETYGYIYVYLTYGMYHCLNITTNKDDIGAVLIRAIEPLTGIEEMKQKRNTSNVKNLTSGPGKLCQAFEITKGLNFTKVNEKISVYKYKDIPENNIVKTERIGIKKDTHLPWRFYIKDNIYVSKK